MAVKDYMASDMAGCADVAVNDDVVVNADVASLMTWQLTCLG